MTLIAARSNLLYAVRQTVKALALMGIILPGTKSRFTPEQRKGLWKAFDRTARKWEPKFKSGAAQCLEHDKREILAIVNGAKKEALRRKASIDWQAIQKEITDYLAEAGDEYWRSVFSPLIEGIVTDQGEKWAGRLGVQFDVQNLRAREWFNNYTQVFAQPINDTTEREIAQVMARAQAEGSSIPQIQNQLEAMFEREISGRLPDDPEFQWFTDRMPPHRTEAIARTETIRASNSGTNELFQEWGVQQHEWLSTQDDRTRTRADGAEFEHLLPWPDGPNGEVRAIDEPFEGTGEPMMYPGDPSGSPADFINCRCTVLPVIPEEGLQPGEMPEEEPQAEEVPAERTVEDVHRELDDLANQFEQQTGSINTELSSINDEIQSIGTQIESLNEALRNPGASREFQILLEEQVQKLWTARRELFVKETRLRRQLKEFQLEVASRGRTLLAVNDPAQFGTINKSNFDANRKAAIKDGATEFSQFVSSKLLPEESQVSFKAGGSGRSNYDLTGNVNLSKGSGVSVVVHELGHWLEDKNSTVHEAAVNFLLNRTAGEEPTPLSQVTGYKGYQPWEVTRKDKFTEPYAGKVYVDKNGNHYATEIISMGLQNFYEQAIAFSRQDPDYFDFIYHLMRGK